MQKILLDKLARAPSKPGVYLMKDAGGNIIYVGKARNQKNDWGPILKKMVKRT